MTVNHLVPGSIPGAGATIQKSPQTQYLSTVKSNLASDYDTFKANYDTIKKLYKVNQIYYYRKRINKKLIRISLRTKNIHVALQRKKILELMGDTELFELTTKDYKLVFEYDTQEELKQVLESVKDIQQSTIQTKLNDYNNVKEKLEVAKDSTNELTFELLENKYIPNKKTKDKVSSETMGDYITTFKELKKYFQNTLINDIDIFRYEEFQISLKNGRTNRTVNKYIRHLKAFIKWAYDRKLIVSDNISGIELLDEKKDLKKRKQKVRNYTKKEILKILNFDYEDEIYNKIFKILSYTGMRTGELYRITNNDIKTENDIYYFDIIDSKSIAGVRKVPLSSELMDIVLNTDFPLMNCSENAYQKRLRSRLYKAIEKEKEDNDTLNVHTLRGTFIENSLNNNRSNTLVLQITQEIVGHEKNEKEALTMDTYGKGQELIVKAEIIDNIDYY